MKNFNLELSEEDSVSYGETVAVGTLTVGDFREKFDAPLSYWDRGQYRSQWRDGLSRLLGGAKETAVITEMYDPKFANFIIWWVMFLVGDSVRIRNRILMMDSLEGGFDEEQPYRHILERETHGDDGELIPELMVQLSDIEDCLERL